jgi:prepilin-type N-terminal cleavage/methylation domain-containing protein
MKGFTLMELLVVIAITLILGVATVPIYGNLQVSSQLNDNTAQIIQTLRTARERSVARYNNSGWGVYFEINAGGSDRYILYQGSSYGARNTDYDRATTLDNALSISSTLSGSEVNFSLGLGVPNNAGTISLTHAVKGLRQVVVNAFGMIEEN